MPRPNSEIAVEEAEVVNLQKSCLKPKTSHHKFDKSIMKQVDTLKRIVIKFPYFNGVEFMSFRH